MTVNYQTSSEASDIFKKAVLAGDLQLAKSKLDQLKAALLEFDSLPPLALPSNNADLEHSIALQTLEYAVILSVKIGDKEAFQRHISSLRPFYTSARSKAGPSSDITNTILGLNLLFLLVENRLSDFHCELELLEEEQQHHPNIAFCSQLDRHLMVGSYDQVMSAASHPPVEYYGFFLKSLLETVRINIGECAAASYHTLSLAAATEILMFSSQQETLAFIEGNYPDWRVAGNQVELRGAKGAKSDEIPAMKIITQTLSYATELERIV